MGTLRGMDKKEIRRRMEKLLPLLNLSEVRRKKIKELSGGMKQRVLLVQALLDDPQILILDEPTAGLDPKERIRIRNLISDLSGDKIVLIATHVVSDIEFISKEILLMKNGKVVDKDCPEALQKKIAGKVFEIRISQDELNQVKQEFEISNLFRTDGEIVVRVISEQHPEKYRWTEVSPTLEDVYLYEFECLCRDA
jgi:ABC-2 type transport system ATP-binding protein|nr:ATP-binding cassette domain-containing protein [Coprococcus sp. LG100-32]